MTEKFPISYFQTLNKILLIPKFFLAFEEKVLFIKLERFEVDRSTFLPSFSIYIYIFFFSKLCPSPRHLRSTIHILLGATIRRDFAASFQRLTPVPSQFLHFQTLWRLCDALRNCFENTRNIEHLVQVAVYNKPAVCKCDSLYSRVQAYKNGTIYRRRLFSYYKKKEVDGYYHKKSLFYLIVIHE